MPVYCRILLQKKRALYCMKSKQSKRLQTCTKLCQKRKSKLSGSTASSIRKNEALNGLKAVVSAQNSAIALSSFAKASADSCCFHLRVETHSFQRRRIKLSFKSYFWSI